MNQGFHFLRHCRNNHVEKCLCFLPPAIEVGETRPIQVDTKSTGKPDAPCKVSVTTPKGKTADLPMKPAPEGFETLFAPLEPGPHIVNVDFAGKPVPDSPFSVDVMPAPEIGAVTVSGLETRKFAHHEEKKLYITYIYLYFGSLPLYSNE